MSEKDTFLLLKGGGGGMNSRNHSIQTHLSFALRKFSAIYVNDTFMFSC